MSLSEQLLLVMGIGSVAGVVMAIVVSIIMRDENW